jgi:GNAT superfamily N-acetyltransferase
MEADLSKKRKKKANGKLEMCLASTEDEAALVEMLQNSLSDDIFAEFGGFSVDAIKNGVGQFIDAGNVILAKDRGKPVGMCGFVRFPLMYNPDRQVVQTLFWWVEHNSRGKGVGARLLDEAQTVARKLGAHLLLVTCRRDEQQASRTCIEKGFKLADSHYLKAL